LLEILLGILVFIAVLYLVVSLFVGKQLREVQRYLKSTDEVDCQSDKYLVFRPKNKSIKAGLVFYPGGFTDAEAYGRIASYLARHGVLTVIVSTWTRLAMVSKNEASHVISAFPDVPGWFIGGHSLGGVAAALYLRNELEKVEKGVIKGMLLLGAFLTDRFKLEKGTVPVLSIYGSRDRLVRMFEATKHNLSQNTTLHRIEGGNHGQFGYYGKHILPDRLANITREEQQAVVEKLALEFIDEVLDTN
jgi:pimeloyl-ACP methyl ester carboxylesterase